MNMIISKEAYLAVSLTACERASPYSSSSSIPARASISFWLPEVRRRAWRFLAIAAATDAKESLPLLSLGREKEVEAIRGDRSFRDTPRRRIAVIWMSSSR